MATADIYSILPLETLIKGTVVNGDKVGRTIGFPTANLKFEFEKITIDPGVYLAQASFQYQGEIVKKPGLAYYGPRHIFGEMVNSFEVFLYDFSGEIYGVNMTVTLTHFMRPPLKISSLSELRAQLGEDKKMGQFILNPTSK